MCLEEMVNEFAFSNFTRIQKDQGADTDIGGAFTDFTLVSNTDVVYDFDTLKGIQASDIIPTEARMHMILINRIGTRLDATVPFDFIGGIRANSSISFTVDSVDGSSATTQITQGDA